MLRDQSVTIKAGATEQLFIEADYLRIKKANIPFRFSTRNGDNFEIKQGDEVNISKFEYVYIKNESANDEVLEIYTGNNERVGSAELSGNVTLNDTNGVLAQSQATVTNANVTILAANPNRKYLLIQNNDTSAVLRVKVDGNNATATAGFRLEAGESLEISTFAPVSAVNVMMETASALANNVEFAEG